MDIQVILTLELKKIILHWKQKSEIQQIINKQKNSMGSWKACCFGLLTKCCELQ